MNPINPMTTTHATPQPKKVVLIYAPEDASWASKLHKHLWPSMSRGVITLWHRDLQPQVTQEESDLRSEQADVLVLLLSANLYAGCQGEVDRALRLHRERGALILPVQVRATVHPDEIVAHGLLPRDEPLSASGRRKDQALMEVAQAITASCDERTRKLLFLSAVPVDGSPIDLTIEAREVARALEAGGQRRRFLYKRRPDVTPALLTEALVTETPDLVHFTGHGAKGGRLVLLQYEGQGQPVPKQALASLFQESNRRGARGVVLCSCYTGELAQEICKFMEFVVGVPDTVEKTSAMAFSGGFYLALSRGETLQQAFTLGMIRAGLSGAAPGQVPELWPRTDIQPEAWRLF